MATNANLTVAIDQLLIEKCLGNRTNSSSKSVSLIPLVCANRTTIARRALFRAELTPYVGSYQLSAESAWAITSEGDQLFAQRTDEPRRPIVPLSPNEFYFPKMPLHRLVFTRENVSAATGVAFHTRFRRVEIAERTDKPSPTTN